MKLIYNHLYNKNYIFILFFIWFLILMIFYFVYQKQINTYSKVAYLHLGGFGDRYVEDPFDIRLRVTNLMFNDKIENNKDAYVFEFNEVGSRSNTKFIYKLEIRGQNPDGINKKFNEFKDNTLLIHKEDKLNRLKNIDDFEVSVKNYINKDLKIQEYVDINYPENNLSWIDFVNLLSQHAEDQNYNIDSSFVPALELFLKNKKNFLSPEYIPIEHIIANLYTRYDQLYRETKFEELKLKKLDLPRSGILFIIIMLFLFAVFLVTLFFELKKSYVKF